MASPEAGVEPRRELTKVHCDGDEDAAMEDLFDDLQRLGADDHGKFAGDATTDPRHVTHENGGSVFFAWRDPPPALFVYAVGRRGETDKPYHIVTRTSGVKAKSNGF